jgi:hypothetical protein
MTFFQAMCADIYAPICRLHVVETVKQGGKYVCLQCQAEAKRTVTPKIF